MHCLDVNMLSVLALSILHSILSSTIGGSVSAIAVRNVEAAILRARVPGARAAAGSDSLSLSAAAAASGLRPGPAWPVRVYHWHDHHHGDYDTMIIKQSRKYLNTVARPPPGPGGPRPGIRRITEAT